MLYSMTVLYRPDYGTIRYVNARSGAWFVLSDIKSALSQLGMRDCNDLNFDDDEITTMKVQKIRYGDSVRYKLDDELLVNKSGIYRIKYLNAKNEKIKYLCMWLLDKSEHTVSRRYKYLGANDMKSLMCDPMRFTELINIAQEQCKSITQVNVSWQTSSDPNIKMRIFDRCDISKLKDYETAVEETQTGCFYILEVDNIVKIGSTLHPFRRFESLRQTLEKYSDRKIGRFAVSIPHSNYYENERMLHTYFAYKRKPTTELFNMTFEETICKLPKSIVYFNDTEVNNMNVEIAKAKLSNTIYSAHKQAEKSNNQATVSAEGLIGEPDDIEDMADVG